MCHPPQLSPQPKRKSMTHRLVPSALLVFLSGTPTLNLTHFDQPLMGNTKKFICWIQGETASFGVQIDPEDIIDDLKLAAVARYPNRFGNIDLPVLTVYPASIEDTEAARDKFASQDNWEAPGSKRIQNYVSETLADGIIHFAIKLPGKQQPSILSTHIC
jgi:hypothetical protein